MLGGSGLVGSAFARHCEREGLEFVAIGRSNYARYVGARCDTLINANGSSDKRLAGRDPDADFSLAVASVQRSLFDFRFDRYLYLSTCDVYPDCSGPAGTEESTRLPQPAQSVYGFHRWLAERLVETFAPNHLILRCGGFVGPGLRKNAVFDILKGGPLWLAPQSELQFLHTDAAAEIAFQLLDRGIRNESFNLCGAGVVSLADVVAWSGREVETADDAKTVRYEVSVEKISRIVNLPDTASTVRRFVEDCAVADSA